MAIFPSLGVVCFGSDYSQAKHFWCVTTADVAVDVAELGDFFLITRAEIAVH